MAQLVRASHSHCEGPWFESRCDHHNLIEEKAMKYFVYILFSLKDKNFYIGFTNNIERRLLEHKLGKVKSTKYRLPFKLVCYEVYMTKQESLAREKYLKGSDGHKDLRKRLNISLDI